MSVPRPDVNGNLAAVMEELAALSQSASKPAEFWIGYLSCLHRLTRADEVVLLVRESKEAAVWKRLAAWPQQREPSQMRSRFVTSLNPLADAVVEAGQLCQPLDSSALWIAGTRIEIGRTQESCVILCLLPASKESEAREAVVRLNLAAGSPREYFLGQSLRQAQNDVERAGTALDIALLVNAEEHFVAAALAFCNAISNHLGCERVSLGWTNHDRVRLAAISRMEKFDRQMAAARALETAMEEALDQDDEILWPTPEDSTVIARDHEAFSRNESVPNLVSVPLRSEGEPVAVLTCERQDGPFTPEEVREIRVCGDVAMRRLADLKKTDRWFGARWLAASREQLGKLLGPERTWLKALAILITVVLAVLIFGRFTYRVEGNFLLRSDEVSYLTAPFDGYIDRVAVRPGDTLPKGGELLSLKTSELELQESAALADLDRYQREAEKARAAGQLAQMRVSQALAAQAQAQLDLVRYRIEQADVKSPFAGVVVEGDLRDRLGAPVKKADVLIKVARLDTLYVEAEVNERDIHEIKVGDTGEIAFASQPKLKFPITVTTIEQAAVPREKENVFIIRCAVEGDIQSWWRPGMSGLCKINTEKRTLLWILTHRTVDFLRMKLWW